MKKLLLLLWSTLLILAVSCDLVLREEEEEADPDVLSHVVIGVKPMDLSDLPPLTKAEVIINQTVRFEWSMGDMVGMYPDRGAQAYFEMSQFAGGTTAEFDGGGWALRSAHEYATYFPYAYEYSDRTAIPFRYADQLQNGKNNYQHLNGYQHLANGAQVPQNGTCNYQMERAEAIVLFKMTLPIPATYNEFTMRISDGTPIVISTTLDISGENYVISPSEYTNLFSLALNGITTTTADEVVTFYAMMPPQNLSGKTIIFSANTTDGDCCQGAVDGKNLINNHAYQFTATLTSDLGSLMEKFGSEGGAW